MLANGPSPVWMKQAECEPDEDRRGVGQAGVSTDQCSSAPSLGTGQMCTRRPRATASALARDDLSKFRAASALEMSRGARVEGA